MASITTANGEFKVQAARRIVANLTLFSPTMPANNTCTYTVVFPAVAAKPNKAMVSSITRLLPGGSTQSNSVVVSAEAKNPVVVPLGVFPGRKTSYTVKDDAGSGDRVVEVTIESLDGSGISEQWRHQFMIILLPTDKTNFDVIKPVALTVDSVDVTP